MTPDDIKNATPICGNKFFDVVVDDNLPPGTARVMPLAGQVVEPDLDVRVGKPRLNDAGTGWVYPVIITNKARKQTDAGKKARQVKP